MIALIKKFFLITFFVSITVFCFSQADQVMTAGFPGVLRIWNLEKNSIRIRLTPKDLKDKLQDNPALDERSYSAPVISMETISKPVKKRVGNLFVQVLPNPIRIIITDSRKIVIQSITFNYEGGFSFIKSRNPILGMGEGGPRPSRGSNWRSQPVEFDRNGSFQPMQPRWQSDMYGSRNPVPLMIGTEGWAIFVAAPWGQIDLRPEGHGLFIPLDQSDQGTAQQTEANQGQNLGKGLPPADHYIKGLIDLFVFDAHDPSIFMKELSLVAGPAVMPPLWALGFMQSHRTLQDENQMLWVINTFREKKMPLDAVIYLGTGFTPRGWNKPQPSFEFNPKVFLRNPEEVIGDIHKKNVKIVLHMVPWDRNKLPSLQGTIPALPGEIKNESHIENYWKQHEVLVKAGIDAFWPDEGDWFNLYERIKRHQMYYQGPISTTPDVRPWSLHRNGYLGIAKWGGWIWSGDTESSWKTLEAQIAVGLNHSLSIGPYWGSDIGGFYPNNEKTGELYARWFQFGAFCGSFRSHGRTWYTAIPWGWGLSDMGARENNNSNSAANDRNNPLQSEMNNPLIEEVTGKYDELRYQLLPYTYTLAWQARTTGMPLMRAMWLHYPQDTIAIAAGNQYLWGKDILIAPVFEKGATSRKLYLPDGYWYDWWTNEKLEGGKFISRPVDLSLMPIYVRAGGIIPVDPVRQYTSEVVTEPTTIKIFRGANGEFELYNDDGISLKYLQGKATITRFRWNDKKSRLTIEPVSDNYSTTVSVGRSYIIELIGKKKTEMVTYKGHRISVYLK